MAGMQGQQLTRTENRHMTKKEESRIEDIMLSISMDIDSVASAITPYASPANDAVGGHVESLTESVMGVTAGLCRIADAINNLAEAVRDGDAVR